MRFRIGSDVGRALFFRLSFAAVSGHPQSESTPRWAVSGALIVVQVFFALNYLAAKVVLREIPPATWALMRVAGAATLLFVVVLVLRRPLPRSRSILGRFAVFSIFGVVINQLCFVEGLSRTTPTHASIIMKLISRRFQENSFEFAFCLYLR